MKYIEQSKKLDNNKKIVIFKGYHNYLKSIGYREVYDYNTTPRPSNTIFYII